MNALHQKLAAQARQTGVADLAGFQPVRLRLTLGSPPREIVSLARRVKADLIVIGASEGGGLRRIFLDSTAESVIRKAPCPVLVLRSETAFPPARVEIPVDLSPISAWRRGVCARPPVRSSWSRRGGPALPARWWLASTSRTSPGK